MGVNLQVYCAAIGLFNVSIIRRIANFYGLRLFLSIISLIILYVLYSGRIILLILSGSLHPNPGPRNVCMSVVHLNGRSLSVVGKFCAISAIADLRKFDLFAFSETWLNSTIPNVCILMSGFSAPLRKARTTNRGGGVALYVADHLSFVRRFDLEFLSTEILWSEIINRFKILCAVCYRPPNQTSEQFLSSFQASLGSIYTQNNFSAIIILVDFNAHFDLNC